MLKNNIKLNKEEREIERSLIAGEEKSRLVTAKELSELQAIAKNTTSKNRMITIRLSERNFLRLKAKALQEGLPYQTVVSSLIQKNV